ncbi:MAG: 50S ribosomal protein L9 [Alphaproteobacteria bacterium]
MQVILLERIERLGNMGDVVNVKPGFARNFLLPKKKALRATDENKAFFDKKRAELEAANKQRRDAAGTLAEKVKGLSVLVVRQAGETAQLYGSVSARDIADAITAAGHTVNRSQILLDRPIKTLGLYPVRVALHPEVIESVTINVARNAEEAERQARGEVITATAEEEAEVAIEELVETPPAEAEAVAEASTETKPKAKRKKARAKDEDEE